MEFTKEQKREVKFRVREVFKAVELTAKFIKQIRDEIISSDYHYNISQRTIEEVFNNYINEK